MTKLYLVTGFLGAGKTTFLNKIFSAFKGKKTSVIVNEFGKVGVDGKIIGERGYDVSEINEGSIFCVCRSDKFMELLNEGYKRNTEVLIVETSGLSDPTGIEKILEDMKKVYNESFDYRGCICLIDAKNFKKVVDTAVVVPSQIKKSSLVIINKTDLVTSEEIEQINQKIYEINKDCQVICTTYSEIPQDKILNLKANENAVLNNKVDILSSSLTINFSSTLKLCDLEKFIKKIAPIIYRCKGYFLQCSNKKCYFIDGVMDDIKISETPCAERENSLVILYKINSDTRRLCLEFCDVTGSCLI